MKRIIRSVWVVYKRSPRHSLRPRRRLQGAAAEYVRRNQERLREAARSHQRTLAKVLEVLRRKGLQVQTAHRMDPARPWGACDGVISVGGDGTFLEAARGAGFGAGRAWLLGVNSDPARSVGSFCATDAAGFEKTLNRILQGRLRPIRLHRLSLELNGRPLAARVLNDLLVTHRRPAAMSRYWIRIGRVKEEHLSSGLWISTAAGSSGAIRSAGGRVLPRSSRSVQYLPRELYPGRGICYRLTGGVVGPGLCIRVGALMEEGMICLDGEHQTIPFRYGDELRVRASAEPLRCFVGGGRGETTRALSS